MCPWAQRYMYITAYIIRALITSRIQVTYQKLRYQEICFEIDSPHNGCINKTEIMAKQIDMLIWKEKKYKKGNMHMQCQWKSGKDIEFPKCEVTGTFKPVCGGWAPSKISNYHFFLLVFLERVSL